MTSFSFALVLVLGVFDFIWSVCIYYTHLQCMNFGINREPRPVNNRNKLRMDSQFQSIPSRHTLSYIYAVYLLKSNTHGLAIRFSTIHRLPCLLNRRQHRLIRHRSLGIDRRGLRVQTDVKGFDT